jgi:hypothetical protein
MCTHFCKKRSNSNCCKRPHYVRDSESRKNVRETQIFAEIFFNYFLLSKWILKNKIIMQHSNAELEKVFQY